MHLTTILLSAFFAIASGVVAMETPVEQAMTPAMKEALAKKIDGLRAERKQAREKLIAATDGEAQLKAANAFVQAGDRLWLAGLRNAGHSCDFVNYSGKSLKMRSNAVALSVTDLMDGTRFLLKIHSPTVTTRLTMDR